MPRERISTTADRDLLDEARRTTGEPDSRMIDAALRALLATYRRTEIDDSYVSGYRQHPLDEPDAWGDLESWHSAAVRS